MKAPGPGNQESRYFDDSYSELVVVRDGVPVAYRAMGGPRPSDEARIAARIRELTGHAVTFGAWVFHDSPNPYDRDCEVPLHVREP
ncbi:MAG: hypothetical protein KF773_27320 [Deltaproteobacteria bacterium]|nr:hypothetical protein [Deltaproteobacteria bacterium]MCW5803007.1 hypothetical protein [Deltaproteobacteria bacterium]